MALWMVVEWFQPVWLKSHVSLCNAAVRAVHILCDDWSGMFPMSKHSVDNWVHTTSHSGICHAVHPCQHYCPCIYMWPTIVLVYTCGQLLSCRFVDLQHIFCSSVHAPSTETDIDCSSVHAPSTETDIDCSLHAPSTETDIDCSLHAPSTQTETTFSCACDHHQWRRKHIMTGPARLWACDYVWTLH